MLYTRRPRAGISNERVGMVLTDRGKNMATMTEEQMVRAADLHWTYQCGQEAV